MANMELLMRSLSIIEDNLDNEIKTEDIAQACYVSKSSLEKMFKESVRFSVYDYIIRRRMMKAAKMMIQMPELSLLDVAVQYGYSSHEAFTRTNSWCKLPYNDIKGQVKNNCIIKAYI